MNNTGSDSLEISDETALAPEPRRVPTRIIVLGLIAVVFAVVVGSQVIGIMYAIFFPPAAPVPGQVTLLSHTSKDYGVDDWLYSSDRSPCEIVRFYVEKDAECRIAPPSCLETDAFAQPNLNNRGQNVARCEATQQFSIFALRWQVVIATGSTTDEITQFRLNREIYWTGAVPPNTAPTLDGDFPS